MSEASRDADTIADRLEELAKMLRAPPLPDMNIDRVLLIHRMGIVVSIDIEAYVRRTLTKSR